MKVLLKSLVFLIFLNLGVFASTTYKTQEIVSNLGVIWGMDFLDENRLILTQKNGKVFVLDLRTKALQEIKNIPKVFYKGQGGLLDIKVSPNYKKDSWIYFTYSKNINNQGATTLARAKLENNSFVKHEDLLITKSNTSTTRHFGSRITFDEKGHLFFSVGDRGVRDTAQNLSNHAGTIIRLNLDGSIPKDNPFVNDKNALDEIYSYGHRNPQGIFYDKKRGTFWAIEHGPRGGDEVNLIQGGANYGWPVISYGKEYWGPLDVGEGTHKKGMLQPIKYYVPSISPSSLIVYNGNVYKELKGKLLAGALKLTHINILTVDSKNNILKETRILENLNERIRNIVQSPNGLIYFSTDSGKILLLKPKF
ncbi:PQQ-dependent sugar dehydrogenase [Arcobacter roscoffensis]|uniref:PQQ-dependent sugar dehydrogenase n=1 Tax=Arcobacter roscoffensis TaxID=2961520 RepID=A0ABY5E1D3_9BACT|nr:PQQ-dependent sugar dehydrogenase [Arcobacter roscoffensis]UTJ05520.1 PQQ-dependent sugar dehydrogenase [Arcobacter roscoffensis]